MSAVILTPDEIADAIANQPLPPTGLEVDVDFVDGGVRLGLTAGNRWLYKPLTAVGVPLLMGSAFGLMVLLDDETRAHMVAAIFGLAGLLLGFITCLIAVSAYQAKASILFGNGRLVVSEAITKRHWQTHMIALVRLCIDPARQITEVLLGIPGEKVFASVMWSELEVMTTDGAVTVILTAFNKRDREWANDVLNEALGLNQAEEIDSDDLSEVPDLHD